MDRCPQCQAPTTPGTKFCGQCGYDLVARPPVEGAKPANPKATMLGGFVPVAAPPKPGQPAPQPAAPTPAAAPQPEPAAAPAPKKRDFAKTVMDAGPPPGALEHLQRQQAPSAPSAPSAKKAVAKTMLGMAAVPPGAMPPADPTVPDALPASPAASPPSDPKAVQKTMLGMAAVPPGAMAPASPAMPQSPASAPAQQAPAPAQQAPAPAQQAPAPAAQPMPKAQTNRTMLGVAAPAPDAAKPKGVPAAKSNRTMLGQPATPAPSPQFAGEPAMPSDPNIPGLRKKSKVPWVGILIGLGLLVGIGAGGAWWMFGRGIELRAAIANSPEGEVLQVDVPGMAEGTKVRFQGREAVLEAGRATFVLAANDLQLGDNTLTVDVVSPDGSVEQGSVVLSVTYRVRADLNSLQSEPPTLRILVDAKPGSTVTIDERNVELDGTGHGFVDLPIDPQAEANVYERSISYHVVVDGEAATGTVETQVPFATLQVDRPGAVTVTDEARVELAGAAHPEATVTLEGTALQTTEGRFVSHLDLAEVGEKEFTLVARRPGRAPRARVLRVQRVEDLEAHAANFPVDESLTYARITQNPESYAGQSAAFVGRVYNVDVHQGKTVLQIVVRDCPRGQRCPMWVTFEGASSAENNSWVRVVGHIAGEQQFRSPNGQVLTVPRIDAMFVLPTTVGRRR